MEQTGEPYAIRGRVRTRAWQPIAHGLYAPARNRTPTEELLAWQTILPPSAAFSHLTAAAWRGWWLPSAIEHPIFVALPAEVSRPRRPGLFVCRHPQPFAMNIVDGLRVTTAAETLLAAARDLGVLDLVVLGDSALRIGDCTVADLWRTAAQRRRGAPLLREVVPLLDARSESPWESIMRVLHRAAQVPVTPQYEIFDPSGRFVARADLRIDGSSRLHEYDGAVHREEDVHRSDLARDRALMRSGWQRYGFTSHELIGDGASIISDLDRLLGRSWDSRRLTAWQDLIDQSLLGRAGRARAYRRWRRSTRP